MFYNAVDLHERAGITTLSKEASKPKNLGGRSPSSEPLSKRLSTLLQPNFRDGSRAGSGVALPYNDEDGCQAKKTARLYESVTLS